MLVIIFIIVLLVLVHSDYKKEGFVSLDTVNNSYKTTQTQIRNIFNDRGNDVEMKKDLDATNKKITTKLLQGPGQRHLKLHSYPINMDGGSNGWGGNFKFNKFEAKTDGSICLDGVCLNADHFRFLRGEKGFSIVSKRTGRRLQDRNKDGYFDNHNDGLYETMKIHNIRTW